MTTTPRGLRPHIVLAGPCNSGKSSLLNAITNSDSALVSEQRGTTTDPVYKNMELLPFGPVTFIDTPGLDDYGSLGELRVGRSKKILSQGDLILFIARPSLFNPEDLGACPPGPLELVFSFADDPQERTIALRWSQNPALFESRGGKGAIHLTSAQSGEGIDELRDKLSASLSAARVQQRGLLEGLTTPGDLVLLVVPIDLEAPAGRLILPQVQTLRESLDAGTICVVVRESELAASLALFQRQPDLVITDSQVVKEVAAILPPEIRLTTFSILLARQKGDFAALLAGARTVRQLADGDRVLIAETCTHKTLCDDIGRHKLPRWLAAATGKRLQVEFCGGSLPDDLSGLKLLVHCGGCMITRTMMLGRMGAAAADRVAVSNYGMVISECQGLLERVAGHLPA